MQGSQSITFIAGIGRRRFPVINQSVVFAWYFLLQRKNVNMASSKRPQRRENHFIYDLPYSITRQICCNLDVDRGWEKLGLYKRQSVAFAHFTIFRLASDLAVHKKTCPWKACLFRSLVGFFLVCHFVLSKIKVHYNVQVGLSFKSAWGWYLLFKVWRLLIYCLSVRVLSGVVVGGGGGDLGFPGR